MCSDQSSFNANRTNQHTKRTGAQKNYTIKISKLIQLISGRRNVMPVLWIKSVPPTHARTHAHMHDNSHTRSSTTRPPTDLVSHANTHKFCVLRGIIRFACKYTHTHTIPIGCRRLTAKIALAVKARTAQTKHNPTRRPHWVDNGPNGCARTHAPGDRHPPRSDRCVCAYVWWQNQKKNNAWPTSSCVHAQQTNNAHTERPHAAAHAGLTGCGGWRGVKGAC